MKESFWSVCTKAIMVSKSGDKNAALSLCAVAKKLVTQQLPESIETSARLNYLVQLRNYIQQLSVQNAPSAAQPNMRSQKKTHSNKIIEKHFQKTLSGIKQNSNFPAGIDPLCISDPSKKFSTIAHNGFGIILFGHTRLNTMQSVLESLQKQDALKYTEVWLDGHQGNSKLKAKINKTISLVNQYPVKHLHVQAGNFGFRKMVLLSLGEMCKKYQDILVLEDDCFPTHDAVEIFREELDFIRNNDQIFSVYGHHFLVESEQETCPRFQGWGWATTNTKLLPILRQLIDCYSMSEENFLEFVHLTFTQDIRDKIEVTPPRQPSATLEKFFAWDETLCLLAALNGQVHRPTRKRTIYNCGIDTESTHFSNNPIFRKPPFNLITPDEVWENY